MDSGHHGLPDHDYGDNQWADMGDMRGSHAHSTPIHEFHGFHFGSPSILPVEPNYNVSIPPPYSSHQQLQPLIMPQWPSVLAGQHSSSYSAPPLATAPTLPTPISSAPYSATPTPVTASGPTPRRTLTDNDRRRMCKYAEDNPTMKQTEIGGISIPLPCLPMLKDASDFRG